MLDTNHRRFVLMQTSLILYGCTKSVIGDRVNQLFVMKKLNGAVK